MWYHALVVLVLVVAIPGTTKAVEEPRYKVVHEFTDFEIRDYPPYLVAETTVASDFEEAGNEGFHRLFAYISGANSRRQPITMTAPVIQSGEKIEMETPFVESGKSGVYAVEFVMPSKFTIETLPIPKDSRVKIRGARAARFASIRYSGFWNKSDYDQNLKRLMLGIEREHLAMTGSPVWARYDPPFIPWFTRRNEILVPIASP